MIKHSDLMEMQRSVLVAGGDGMVEKQIILSPEEMQNGARMFARVKLEPGCSIGEHQHVVDSEVYYILKGQAEVTDNGVVSVLNAGDVLFTQLGGRHSIVNKSNEDVEFVALILSPKTESLP